MKKWLLITTVVLVALTCLTETGLRLLGVIDFPIYKTDSSIGYIPASNQNGSFLNRYEWVLNEKNMGVSESWKPNGDKDLLLVGDSIVWGGNPIDQSSKLGPQLEARLGGWEVWPVSAGSWSVRNPLVWMQRHPEVLSEVDTVVWIVNSGDLAPASQWASEQTHPRSRPKSALAFVVTKYLLPRLGLSKREKESTGSENLLSEADAKPWFEKLSSLRGCLKNHNLANLASIRLLMDR